MSKRKQHSPDFKAKVALEAHQVSARSIAGQRPMLMPSAAKVGQEPNAANAARRSKVRFPYPQGCRRFTGS